MRALTEIKPEIKALIDEYKMIKSGNKAVRFCLCNAYKSYWLLSEILEVISHEKD